MSMDLSARRTFVKVAELASFTRAAEQLGMPKARVSTTVQQLEAELGTRLLHRTTRTVRLTADGEQFRERCLLLLADADELQSLFQRTPGALRGRLRVDVPIGMAQAVLMPRLPAFLAAHPQVELELSTTDRRVDLVHEGFDCVLRVGTLDASDLVARRLGELAQVNVASPAYLALHGTPRTLADLAAHRLVRYAPGLGAGPALWEYEEEGRYRTLAMPSTLTVTSSDAYQSACLAGLGLIQAPVMGMQPLIDAGRLVRVLSGFDAPPMPVSLLYPHRRQLSKRVQALMAWMDEVLEPFLAGKP
ncbi:LysR family transcriptional regulator [Variovorax sp. UMC13]|uniref:LysR family transcriptional regulator n=1 Tax=Variovorax sp. UMC13 TaxID=1862326 RepID=UPI001600A5A0|nr:LysR family transcriptional regulator [Variovorax sp. UMC13]MBB1604639.1 transcriptional regulator [Variovorax sp. UMC13]